MPIPSQVLSAGNSPLSTLAISGEKSRSKAKHSPLPLYGIFLPHGPPVVKVWI